MRRRQTQIFPAQASSVTFPTSNESWRIVSCFARITSTDATAKQLQLTLEDGGGNIIAQWSAPLLALNTLLLGVTFSAAGIDSSQQLLTPIVTGSSFNVPIPDDVWIQPQWLLSIGLAPANAGDALTEVALQTETYDRPAKKGSTKIENPSQDA